LLFFIIIAEPVPRRRPNNNVNEYNYIVNYCYLVLSFQEEFENAKVLLLSHELGNDGDISPLASSTGISVYDALKTSNPRLPVSEWLGVARDVAQELTKMHKVGFVHTDLHTGNVLLFQRNLQGAFSTERSWQAKVIGLESAKPMYAASPVYTEATDIYAFGFLIACIGHFRNIGILSTMAERCMKEEPSERIPLAVISRELSYFISRYQKKERWGIEIKRRGWSMIDADAQKRRGMYTKKKTVGVLIAEETDLYDYLMNL